MALYFGKGEPQTSLLLDFYPNAAAAYSFSKIRNAYAGNAVKIRRSSDNAEQDFGFTANGSFDAAAAATFIGGGTGFITIWYDQSESGYNATQTDTSKQPTYSTDAGGSASFDGNSDTMSIPSGLGSDLDGLSEISMAMWFKGTNSRSAIRIQPSGYVVISWDSSGSAVKAINSVDGGTSGLTWDYATMHNGSWHHMHSAWKQSGTWTIYQDGTSYTFRAATANVLNLGAGGTYLGTYQGTSEHTAGLLDMCIVWPYQLNATQAAELYSNYIHS